MVTRIGVRGRVRRDEVEVEEVASREGEVVSRVLMVDEEEEVARKWRSEECWVGMSGKGDVGRGVLAVDRARSGRDKLTAGCKSAIWSSVFKLVWITEFSCVLVVVRSGCSVALLGVMGSDVKDEKCLEEVWTVASYSDSREGTTKVGGDLEEISVKDWESKGIEEWESTTIVDFSMDKEDVCKFWEAFSLHSVLGSDTTAGGRAISLDWGTDWTEGGRKTIWGGGLEETGGNDCGSEEEGTKAGLEEDIG